MSQKVLDGIKVLDFGAFMAGPAASAFLGFLGAEIIKVEHPSRPDGGRFFLTSPTQLPPDPRSAASQTYDLNNFGKLGLAIDFASEDGKEVMWKLIDDTDILVQNMSAGTMERLGFGYDAVRERKPDIIYLSSSACGESGPEKDFIGYASTFAAKAGLGALTGYPDSPPSTFVGSIDIRSANAAVVAIMSALFYRKNTGKGQYIEIASQEAIASQLGEVYLDCIVNGRNQGPMANTRPGFAPQGAYKALGDDEWVAISVETDAQWTCLCEAMGKNELVNDSRFASYEDRYANLEELDDLVAQWTEKQDKFEVFKTLQAVNVPCGPVYNSKGVHEDPHRVAREAYIELDSRDLGTEYAMRPAWRLEKTPPEITSCAPYHGEHTTQILKKRLGMSDREIQVLVDKRVLRRLLDYDSKL